MDAYNAVLQSMFERDRHARACPGCDQCAGIQKAEDDARARYAGLLRELAG